MGGRGASSGLYYFRGKTYHYGDEFKSLLEVDNIKFVTKKDGTNLTAPQETMTKGRIYATVSEEENKVIYITFFDDNNKRSKQIDLAHAHDELKPHTHTGYYHDEGGTRGVNEEEKLVIDKVLKAWKNKGNK